ncbi:MAG: choice-of-anchor D domain-containing protein [Planctomycetes bacterium]|nr:choice-of-anchor D domain-containing protein [Planctomycetota bacterium]
MAVTAIVSTALSAQTFTSNPNLPIADNVSQSDSMNVTGVTGAVTSLRVDLRIDHTWDSDLSIWLIPPGVADPGSYAGTPPAGVIDLCSGNGGSANNFGTGAVAPFVYTQISSASDPVTPGTVNITAGAAPFTAAVYIPEGTAAFDALYNSGSPNGTWILGIADTATGDTGVLLSWQLAIVGGGAGNSEIGVSRGATNVADGSTDNVGTLVTGITVPVTYSISNGGLQDLTITTPVAAPGTLVNCTATISTQPTSPVTTGNSTTLVVDVTPTAAGAWSCTITFANNDPNENPYDFTIAGDAASPDLAIADNSPTAASIFAPATDAVVARFTATSAAGAQTITSVEVAKTGTLPDGQITEVKLWEDTNSNGTLETGTDTQIGGTQVFASGTASFTGLTSVVTNPTVGNYLISFSLAGTATPGDTFGCDVTAVVATPGPVSGTPTTGSVHNVSGYFSALPFLDDFEPATTIFNRSTQIDGTFPSGGTPPTTVTYAIQSQIQFGAVAASGVTPSSGTNQAGIDFPNGQSAGAIDYAFDLSAYNANTDTLILDFNWAETGDENTAPDGVYLSLDGGATWSLQLYVLQNGTTVLQNVVVDVSAALVAATLNYTNQVIIRFQGDDNFPFATDGHVFDDIQLYELAEMDVLRGATPVADGGTDTGVQILTTGSNLTYTIENTGGVDLNLTGTPLVVVTAGTNVSTVTVTTPPTSPVAGGGSTTFVINVVPTAAGAYDFTVSIDNDDSDENPYDFTVSGNAISNLPPVVANQTGSNWVDMGGGLFTLTVNPGAAIADTLEVTDPTPDNMTVDVVTSPSFTGLTAQPVDITTPTAGPISLTWTGTANGSNTPGNYDWAIDIGDGVSTVSITARIIVVDVAPQHTAATGISGDGSVGTPYATTYAENDLATQSTNLANVTDANTGQVLNLTNVAQSSGPTTGSGFTFTLLTGVLSVAPSATLNANDVGTQVFSMDIDDGTNTVTVNVSITVLGNSGAITFTNTSPLAAGTVGSVYATVTLTATGGTGPYTYSLANGTSLPAGLSLSATGDITGTPTTAGTVSFDVRAVDSLNDSAVASFQITINAPSSGSGGGGGDDGGCSTGGNAPYSWMLLLGLLSLAALAFRLRKA